MNDFSELKGKVITQIEGDKNSEELWFHCSDGSVYKMYHEQDCCENVSIEDIDGDLSRIIGKQILIAEETSSGDDFEYGTCTWTFYKLGNNVDTVTIRWYGESNGYYSESANFVMIEKPKQEAQMDYEKEKKALDANIEKLQGLLKQAQLEKSIIEDEEAKMKKIDETILAKAAEKIGKFWGDIYDKPEHIDVKLVKVGNEKGIDINISRQYSHPKLTFAVLKKISELFDTERIDTYDEWSRSGCDTCDYGSSYGYTIRVLPREKGGKLSL